MEHCVLIIADTGKKIREKLVQAQQAKVEEDREIELIRADRIRQLKAVNTVHRTHIKVFDPTTVKGPLFLDQMSYMEMKERQTAKKIREDEKLAVKAQDIIERKEKKSKDLETRLNAIMRCREAKASANRASYVTRKDEESKAAVQHEKLLEASALVLDEELRRKRAEKKKELEMLKAEEERIKRQQQYLGAAAGIPTPKFE